MVGKRFGGVTIVQDPEEAEFPEMPLSALSNVEIDDVMRVSEMGEFLSELAHGNTGQPTSFQAKAVQERRKWK